MQALTDLYQSLQEENVYFDSHHVESYKAVTVRMDDDYAIFVDYSKIKTLEEEFNVVVHEYGHCVTGTTHKLASKHDLISRHEYRANKGSVHKFLPFKRYLKALKSGCTEFWEMAEYLELPEEFVRKAEYIYRCEGLLNG